MRHAAVSASSASTITTSSQRTGSSSPRKRRAQLEVEAEEPIEVRSLRGRALPPELFRLVSKLEKVASGDTQILHPSLRQGLQEAAHAAEQKMHLGQYVPDWVFAEETYDDGATEGQQGLVDDVDASRVSDVLLAALRCEERKQDENGWNQAVHHQLLRLALPPDGFVDFEPCYAK